ncbi:MAG: RNA-binding cell elongation regulator Jag/EloR [Bacilli bacterium]
MKKKTYEVKSVSEAIELAVKDLGINESELTADVINEKKGFLGLGGKLEVEVKPNVDGIEKGKQYIQMLLETNNVQGFIEKRVRGNVVEFNIDAGDFNGVLIGKNSKHLVALQTLINLIINSYYEEDNQMVVRLDIGGYRRRRESQLERLAIDFGKQVAKTKQEIKLDNLNSYERKIIHDKLSTWKDVQTRSEGEEPNRFLIIEPK